MKKVIITIGCPGSGKSTRVKDIVSKNKNVVVCSADNFFMKNGVYEWNPSKIRNAHEYCQKIFLDALNDDSIEIIIVDNTNITKKDRKFYIDNAKKFTNNIEFLIPEDFKSAVASKNNENKLNQWVEIFAKRNVHNVPAQTIKRMILTYQRP